jgi:Zn-dependent M28 family amino/carboxypeptidase
MKKIILSLLVIANIYQTSAQRIIADHLFTDISFLASDDNNGRATSTPDELIVADYIANRFKAIGLQAKGTKGYFFDYTYKISAQPHDTNVANQPIKKGRNVIAFLDNKAKYSIVIGAHFDHCGRGYDGNSLDANPKGKIHNGADDNASGVADVLELARYFTNNGIQENYNFLFMTFSGEELGLIGSKKWCENPSYPLSKINYMLNMDMIGRLNDSTKKLLIYGVGTSNKWLPAIEKTNSYFVPKYDSAGVGPSDQTSFYLKDIPVLHFFTGQHSDYHKPTDDADKINYNGEANVLDFMIDLIFALDEQPKLDFMKTKTSDMSTSSFKVTMGVMPDYAYDGEGLRLDGVSDNKPASNAGLQVGDVIIQIEKATIRNMQDYMEQLGQHEKGETVRVIFIRKNERMETMLMF